MPSSKKRGSELDTKFDRRSAHRAPQNVGGEHQRRADDATPRKRRATRDGREPLVIYMSPETIKTLKIAALQLDTTASAIVSEAVSAWLKSIEKRRPK